VRYSATPFRHKVAYVKQTWTSEAPLGDTCVHVRDQKATYNLRGPSAGEGQNKPTQAAPQIERRHAADKTGPACETLKRENYCIPAKSENQRRKGHFLVCVRPKCRGRDVNGVTVATVTYGNISDTCDHTAQRSADQCPQRNVLQTRAGLYPH
jgi:hypothetical protein